VIEKVRYQITEVRRDDEQVAVGSQHIVDTGVRRAMAPSVSQDLWALNGSMRRSFNIVECRSVSKIARLERRGVTIFASGSVAGYGWVAILAGFEPLAHEGSTPCPRLPCAP
jgi:hypothetical protein